VSDTDATTSTLASALGWGRGDARGWLFSAVAGVAAYACTGLFVVVGRDWQVPLFVGLLVGLVGLVSWRGALVALVCVLGGDAVRGAMFPQVALTPPGAALGVVLAVLGGAIPGLVWHFAPRDSRRLVVAIFSAILVAWTILNLWLPLFATGNPPTSYGVVEAHVASAPPQPGTYSGDPDLFRAIFYYMHAGEPYYTAARHAWAGLERAASVPSKPWAVRLPTYFWVWKVLPNDAFAVVYLFLVIASVGVVASSLIAGQIAGARLAPLSAVALAAYARFVGGTWVVYFVDLPAMCVALVGVALYVWATRTRSMGALWAAASVMLAAALTREILFYLILLAGLATLLEPAQERLKRALPWAASALVFAAFYAWHTAVVSPLLSSYPVTWTNGGLRSLVSALTSFGGAILGSGTTLVALIALGIVGAIASARRMGRPFSAFATAATVIPWLVMLRIGNPAQDFEGNILNYWGMLVTPLALSLWPAAALITMRRSPAEETPSGT
jgi:hypothetical protein